LCLYIKIMIAEKVNLLDFNILRLNLQGQIDNTLLKASVMRTEDDKVNPNPKSGPYEDNNLDLKDPIVIQLRQIVDGIFRQLDNRFEKSTSCWGHILYDGQSTIPHNHRQTTPDKSGSTRLSMRQGLSWCYYVDANEDSGDIVFDTEYRGLEFAIAPETSKMFIFPNWLKHYTKRNHSKKVRVSISGNVFLTDEQLRNPAPDVTMILGPNEYSFKRLNFKEIK